MPIMTSYHAQVEPRSQDSSVCSAKLSFIGGLPQKMDSLNYMCKGFPLLHMQNSLEKVDSYILIQYRYTNKRHSKTIKRINLPTLAPALLTLIGKIYYVFKIKVCFLSTASLLQFICWENLSLKLSG